MRCLACEECSLLRHPALLGDLCTSGNRGRSDDASSFGTVPLRLLREVHLKGVPPQIVVQMWRKSVLSEEENVRARTGS